MYIKNIHYDHTEQRTPTKCSLTRNHEVEDSITWQANYTHQATCAWHAGKNIQRAADKYASSRAADKYASSQAPDKYASSLLTSTQLLMSTCRCNTMHGLISGYYCAVQPSKDSWSHLRLLLCSSAK